jgi:ribonuclease HII
MKIEKTSPRRSKVAPLLGALDHRKLLHDPVIGVDEVGRGCLAGRVYAAAAILPAEFNCQDIDDSKKISAARREILSEQIKRSCPYYIAFASVEEIDQINILQASLLAMKRAVLGLVLEQKLKSALIAVDGNQLIKDLGLELSKFPQQTFVEGDRRLKPIGAASIIAKVARDSYMNELNLEFPHYGFASHKAYATAQHRSAIQKFGPCRVHRKTFGGVKEYLRSEVARESGFEI